MLCLRLLMCHIVWVLLCAVLFNTISCCHESDRSLLLMFKQGVVDPSNRLSSWSSLQDCCQWHGVTCDPDTNRVRALILQNTNQNGSESLRGEINLSSLLSLQFLEELDLEDNDFERISMPSINNSVATTHSNLLANSSKLFALTLSGNIHLHFDNLHYWFSRLPYLTSLDLCGIHLPSETNWFKSLALLPLEKLALFDCNLTTSILSLQNANFSSLSYLDLSLNDFTYGLPSWLFNLSKDLSVLHLGHCNLRGPIPDFSAYQNLLMVGLSNNKLKGSLSGWIGQLGTLTDLDLSINNSFHRSTLRCLDISFNDLSGELPKNLTQRSSIHLDLSHNSISGDISNLLLNNEKIFLSFNKFEGRLPRVSNSVQALDLSYNSFSESLSSLLCHTETDQHPLEYLDLSNNHLFQELPHCWNNWTHLSFLYLGNNQLVGQIPPMIGSSLYQLRALDLHNNGFFGDISWIFHNCSSLMLLNLEGNNFSGDIKTWMPQNVSVLKLRSNHFTGNITSQVCSLSNLIVLDLSNNNFSGPIPHCLHITTSLSSENALFFELAYTLYGIPMAHQLMKTDLYKRGQQLEYEKNLKLVRSIDLSANKLSGEIPTQLFKLTKLQFLNLSYNYLIGEIPEQIGDMEDLESLDLSHNNLHGNIPQSMSGLSFLSDLNLSYNHFSGQIPLGTQLQSFDTLSYTGNPELCGPPLQKNCTILERPIPERPVNTEQLEGNEDDGILKSLYLGMGVGFAVGFWVVCGTLFLNKACRHTYFQFFDSVVDRIYVAMVIKLRRFG